MKIEVGMELTKYELKLAEISIKKYRRFLYRKSQLIGWFGAGFFILGLLRILPLSPLSNRILVDIGFVVLMWSIIATAMTVIGKLYEHVQNLEAKHDKR